MAERPQSNPPAIAKWQSFLSYYAKQNPGSSKQEASKAWAEYKEQHGIVNGTTKKSSTRKQSPKKSPKNSPKNSPIKKSPLRFGGTLPKDVLHIIASNIEDAQTIGRMTIASKITGNVVLSKLEKLCNAPITETEILSTLDSLPLPLSLRLVMTHHYTNIMHGRLFIFGRKADEIVVYDISYGNNSSKLLEGSKPIRLFIEQFILDNPEKRVHIILSPLSLLDLYKRKVSCLRFSPTYISDKLGGIRRSFMFEVGIIFRDAFREKINIDFNIIYAFVHGDRAYFDKKDLQEGINNDTITQLNKSYVLIANKVGWICNQIDYTYELVKMGKMIKDTGKESVIRATEFIITCVNMFHYKYSLIKV